MAERLGGYIQSLPSGDLKLRFLQTQQAILHGIAGTKWDPQSQQWVNNVVTDFMNPFFAALDGNGNARWNATFADVAALTASSNALLNSPDAEFGAGPALVLNDLLASRAMALTHITQDLRNSLIINGTGTDGNWSRIGSIVSGAQWQFFNPVEIGASWVGGRLVSPTFDVSLLRDQMRNQLKAAGY